MMPTVEILIPSPAGVRLHHVPLDASTDAVVWRAAAACGLAPSQLALFCGGRRLGGPALLWQSGVRGGAALRVAQRHVGGGAGAGRERGASERTSASTRASERASAIARAPRVPLEMEAPARPPHLPPARGVEVEVEVSWKIFCGAEIEAVLASGAIALLDAEWMMALAARGGVLEPRQALPDDAFLSLGEMQAGAAYQDRLRELPIVCISHCWLQPDHPDPHGHNLRAVARALGHLTQRGGRFGVFYDFCSIHQNCRGRDGKPQGRVLGYADGQTDAVGRFPQEDALFKQALSGLGAFYSHPSTRVLLLTALPPDHGDPARYTRSNMSPYFERGWCACESSWAGMVKDCVLDLGKDAGEGKFDEDKCMQGRKAPVLHEVFEAQLASKSFTNGTVERPLVARLYRQGFEARFGAATVLRYASLGWGDEEARAVAGVVPRAPALVELDLSGNSIGDEGARALAEALPRASALRLLNLNNNSISAVGTRSLAEALPHTPALKELKLSVNDAIGDEGARALAEVLPRASTLKELHLCHNSIGDEGARALAEALPHAPTLEKLELSGNSIGDEGAHALAEALPRVSALEELGLLGNSIGAEGARALAEVLPRAPALRALNIERNKFGDAMKVALRLAWEEREGGEFYV